MISNLTFKLFYNMKHQLITGDKQSTDLLKYTKHYQRVYQGLKDLARMIVASEKYTKKYAAAIATAAPAIAPAKKVNI